MNIESLAELSDTDLLARVERLVHSERQATAALVAHLAEIANRKLYVAQGYASLFSYCMQALHLSEHAAYNRIEAARAAMRYPAVLTCLARGDVHLTAVRLLSPLFTPENHRELLAAARHRSKRQVEELIARLRPQPDAPASVRRLPSVKAPRPAGAPMTSVDPAATPTMSTDPAAKPATNVTASVATGAAPESPTGPAGVCTGKTMGTPSGASTARPAVVVPLGPERYKVQFTANAAMREKLRRAQELLRHRIPGGDLAEVIDLALDLLVRDLEKKKFAATDRPRGSGAETGNDRVLSTGSEATRDRARGTGAEAAHDGARRRGPEESALHGTVALESSRHIPAEVKRAVWQRDEGRCTFTGPHGVRCTERGQLEFDHVRPHADGGAASIGNVRLLCRRHNQYEARQFFGLWQAERTPEAVPR